MKSSCVIPELLAPAGNYDKLCTAIRYGADAVYLGGEHFSLRARAGNFDVEGLRQAVATAHAHQVRVYVTVNIFAHNRDLPTLPAYLAFLQELTVDGLIIADPGILAMARQYAPKLALHLSTQANVTNWSSACFWAGLGIRRLNLARELGLEEICAIRAATDAELEVFVHGALCISYSGRCLLSSYFTGRDANQGDCAQPCRYHYALMEEKRPGQYFPVEEDGRGTYIFNSRDLCLLPHLPALIAAGVNAFKLEGRMRSVGYVGAMVRLYRLALDWIAEQLSCGEDLAHLRLPEDFLREADRIGTRGRTENFFSNPPSEKDMLHDTMRVQQCLKPAAIVCSTRPLLVDVRHAFSCGEKLEYLDRSLAIPVVTVTGIWQEDGSPVNKTHPGRQVLLRTDPPLQDPKPHSILRKTHYDDDPILSGGSIFHQ